MKTTGQHLLWQRALALLSVLAVVFGVVPHDPTGTRGTTPVLGPSPLPEMRAAVFLPPVVPLDVGEAPNARSAPRVLPGDAERKIASAHPGHLPAVRARTGIRQLEGG